MVNPTPLPMAAQTGATIAAVYPRRVMRPVLASSRELRTLTVENFIAMALISAGFGGISFAIGIFIDWLMQESSTGRADVLVQVLSPISGGFGLFLIIVGIIVLLYRKGDIEAIEAETYYPDDPGEAIVLGGVSPIPNQPTGDAPESTDTNS